MQRALNIAELWNWLPAFRAVGEYESIQRAALAMHVSPSALSRTIRLLEDAVGMPLFGRAPTGLMLTEFGKELLAVTRDAMRRVDDVLADRHSHASTTRGISASAVSPTLLSLLATAAANLFTATTTPRIQLGLVAPARLAEELLTGKIDFALAEADAVSKLPDELAVNELGQLVFALHALSSVAKTPVPTTSVVVLGDVVVEGGYDVVGSAASLEAAVALAAAGRSLAFVPRALAPEALERVDGYTVAVPLVGVVRRPIGAASLPWVEELTRALREAVSR